MICGVVWSPIFTCELKLTHFINLHSTYSSYLCLNENHVLLKLISTTLTSHLFSLLTLQLELYLLLKNMHCDTNYWICSVNASKTKVKKMKTYCWPLVQFYSYMESFVAPSGILTLFVTRSHIPLIAWIMTIQTLLFSRTFHKTSLGTLLYVSSKSTKIICKSFYFIRYCSINFCSKYIASMVALPGIKPKVFNDVSVLSQSLLNYSFS